MALRVALSRLVFVLSLISFAAMAISEDCPYEVSVKTGDVPKAQTGFNVSIKLVSCTGKNFTIRHLYECMREEDKGSDYMPFQRGQVDVFHFSATCLDVCAMTITNNAPAEKIYSGWYLESVNVTRSTGDDSELMQFPVYRWLANDVPPNKLSATVNDCNCSEKLKSALSSE